MKNERRVRFFQCLPVFSNTSLDNATVESFYGWSGVFNDSTQNCKQMSRYAVGGCIRERSPEPSLPLQLQGYKEVEASDLSRTDGNVVKCV